MFDRKLISRAILNLFSRLRKMLSHLATSYHVLSHLITPYPTCSIKNNLVGNFKFSTRTPYKYHILPHLITSYHTLSPMFHRKIISVATFNLVLGLLKSYHIFQHLITSYHALTSMFERKLISRTTLKLLTGLLIKLSHHATSYDVLSHLITLYPPC